MYRAGIGLAFRSVAPGPLRRIEHGRAAWRPPLRFFYSAEFFARAECATRRRDSTSNCRFNQSFSGSTMAGAFFGAPGGGGTTGAGGAAGGAVVTPAQSICGLASVACVVTAFGSA